MQPMHLVNYNIGRKATASASNVRNDAEGATCIAAVLNLEGGARAVVSERRDEVKALR